MFGGISRVLLGCKYFEEALLSTDYPLNSFCPQIITDYKFQRYCDYHRFGTEIHGFLKSRVHPCLKIYQLFNISIITIVNIIRIFYFIFLCFYSNFILTLNILVVILTVDYQMNRIIVLRRGARRRRPHGSC